MRPFQVEYNKGSDPGLLTRLWQISPFVLILLRSAPQDNGLSKDEQQESRFDRLSAIGFM
jgi:hypothetical protein